MSISGAIAALGDTLFPATSFAQGLRDEFSSAAHFLLRLRILHPALAVASGLLIAFAAVPGLRAGASSAVRKLAVVTTILLLLQIAAGVVNVLLLAPIWLQLTHLFLANALWISLVALILESAAPRANLVIR